MPKMKTNSSAKKRKAALAKDALVHDSEMSNVKVMLRLGK